MSGAPELPPADEQAEPSIDKQPVDRGVGQANLLFAICVCIACRDRSARAPIAHADRLRGGPQGAGIGSGFDTPQKRAVGLLIGGGAIVADLGLVAQGSSDYQGWRLMPLLMALYLYRFPLRVDRGSLGLRLNPIQGWWYWCKATALIAVAVLGAIVVLTSLLFLVGGEIDVVRSSPAWWRPTFVRMCLLAPIVEETAYRIVLCAPTVACFRPAITIGISGVAFVALHVLYGTLAIENIVAGFVLAWAYLKSGTVLVPMFMHSLGNFCAMLVQFAAWYALGPSTT